MCKNILTFDKTGKDGEYKIVILKSYVNFLCEQIRRKPLQLSKTNCVQFEYITVQGPPNLWQHNLILKLNIFNFML